MSRQPLWLAALVLVTAIWGWSFVAKHDSLATLSASALNACTFLLAAASLLPFVIRALPRLSRRDWAGGISIGAVLFLAFTLQTSGVGLTTPSNAGFITGLTSVFTPLILFLIGQGRPSLRQAIGTLIALTGLGLLSLEGFSLHVGDLLILGCAVGFASHVVMLSRIRTAASAQTSAFIQLSTVGVLSLIWSQATGDFALPDSYSTLSAVVAIALLGTALAYYIQTGAQAVLAPRTVALVLICEPVFSGLFGYFLAGDRFTAVQFFGALLILGGIVISELRRAAVPASA
ncbi:DMT family transporter [Pseudomonas sp. dw_358]|uniref:DMT family transporter n=1 Tax=Pseudomonas sp. dw_358 TaxID=2720083 RepID=UPI001BD663E7|nr:DMT family transporter [Pseudomonas sp. dw_358]